MTVGSGDMAQLVECWTGLPQRQVWFPRAARDYSPRVNFQRRFSHGVHTHPCVITCINICARVKDPVVHVRVWWIMETLKHPAGTVAWLCHSWFPPVKAIQIFLGRNSTGTTHLWSKKKYILHSMYIISSNSWFPGPMRSNFQPWAYCSSTLVLPSSSSGVTDNHTPP